MRKASRLLPEAQLFGQISGITSRMTLRPSARFFSVNTGLSSINYNFYKNELINNFIDSSGMVCNRKIDSNNPDGKRGDFCDQGDSAWRTGLYAIALALEGDAHRLIPVMQTLQRCWSNDNTPLRHPSVPGSPYTRDQFIPQMAASLFSWRLGMHIEHTLGDAPLGQRCQNVGQGLLQKFVSLLAKPDLSNSEFRFGPNSHPTAGKFDGHEQWILSKIAEQMGVDVWHHHTRGGNEAGGNSLYLQIMIDIDKSKNSNALDYYSIHNMFWKMFCLWVVRPGSEIGQQKIQWWLERMADASVIQRNGLYFCAGNRVAEASQLSKDWGYPHDKVDYFWQRNRKQQDDAMGSPRRTHVAPVAPMILHCLLNYPDYARPFKHEAASHNEETSREHIHIDRPFGRD